MPFEQTVVSSTMTSLLLYEGEQYRDAVLGLSASEKKMLVRVDKLAISPTVNLRHERRGVLLPSLLVDALPEYA
jgi:hypothetical protein